MAPPRRQWTALLQRVEPLPTPNRAYMAPVWGRQIQCDFTGLHSLATELYMAAAAAHPHVNRLIDEVNSLLGEQDGYAGDSSEAFRAAYAQDAKIMISVAKLMFTTATIVDTYVSNLAALQAEIDREIDIGLQAGYFTKGAHFDDTGLPEVRGVSGAVTASDRLYAIISKNQEQAKSLREKHSKQFTKISSSLLDILDYFKGKSNPIQGPSAPGTLLSMNQNQWYDSPVQRLRDQLNDAGGLTAKDVQLIGTATTTAGGVISVFNPPVGGAVAAGGGVVNVLGQIAEHSNTKK